MNLNKNQTCETTMVLFNSIHQLNHTFFIDKKQVKTVVFRINGKGVQFNFM